jgi:hypothetical protein
MSVITGLTYYRDGLVYENIIYAIHPFTMKKKKKEKRMNEPTSEIDIKLEWLNEQSIKEKVYAFISTCHDHVK